MRRQNPWAAPRTARSVALKGRGQYNDPGKHCTVSPMAAQTPRHPDGHNVGDRARVPATVGGEREREREREREL